MAFVQILSGGMKGRRIPLETDELTVGRAPSNDLVVDDTAVSGRHCAIRREGRKYSIRDHGSTNGSRLNGEFVTESRLKPKDIIMLGAVEILFDGDDVDVDEAVPKNAPRSDPPPTVVLSSRFAAGRAARAENLSAGFERKRSRKGILVVLGIAVGIALAVLGYLFVVQLMGSKAPHT